MNLVRAGSIGIAAGPVFLGLLYHVIYLAFSVLSDTTLPTAQQWMRWLPYNLTWGAVLGGMTALVFLGRSVELQPKTDRRLAWICLMAGIGAATVLFIVTFRAMLSRKSLIEDLEILPESLIMSWFIKTFVLSMLFQIPFAWSLFLALRGLWMMRHRLRSKI